MAETKHLDPAKILALAEGGLTPDELARAEGHLASCGTCRAELALARTYDAEAVGADLGERSDRLRSEFRRRLSTRTTTDTPAHAASGPGTGRRGATLWWGRGLLAASIAVIALGAVQIFRATQDDDLGRTVRSGGTHARVAVEVTEVENGWQVEWQTDLSRLTLRVITADGDLALETSVEGTGTLLRRDALAAYRDATPLFVQLEGLDAQGDEVRSSPVVLP